ncbi:hypothetical protein DH2020_000568 [Rehmannia glutinosa]|uniref:NTF2 domain-containing protein n=1 Tax=Rehmannia glutinosa TaxID=99300 RepID=A0ABR0XX81_REHGL
MTRSDDLLLTHMLESCLLERSSISDGSGSGGGSATSLCASGWERICAAVLPHSASLARSRTPVLSGYKQDKEAINEKIVSLNYGDFRAEIKAVDAQESFNGGVHVLVTGYLTGTENTVRNFAQSFFLAPQEKGYFVLNDMFRYVDNVSVNPALVVDVVVPVSEESIPAPIQENHVSEQSTPTAEEAIAGEVYNPPENGDVPVVEEEVPVAEVVDEVQDETQMIVESSAKIEEVPKKSYASIVMHLKESAATLPPPTAAPRKAPPKNIEQVNPTFAPATDGPVSSSESQQGFVFGFVEFEEASSVQKALEASPVTIGGRNAFVEEKRSTNSRGKWIIPVMYVHSMYRNFRTETTVEDFNLEGVLDSEMRECGGVGTMEVAGATTGVTSTVGASLVTGVATEEDPQIVMDTRGPKTSIAMEVA